MRDASSSIERRELSIDLRNRFGRKSSYLLLLAALANVIERKQTERQKKREREREKESEREREGVKFLLLSTRHKNGAYLNKPSMLEIGWHPRPRPAACRLAEDTSSF